MATMLFSFWRVSIMECVLEGRRKRGEREEFIQDLRYGRIEKR
jgi:hypothetical protein